MRNMAIVWDVDGTLVDTIRTYNELYAQVSYYMFGASFCMSHDQNGEFDPDFFRCSNPQILHKRLDQLGLTCEWGDEKVFFENIGDLASRQAKWFDLDLFHGSESLTKIFADQGFTQILLSGGPREMHKAILGRAGVGYRFNWELSSFLYEYEDEERKESRQRGYLDHIEAKKGYLRKLAADNSLEKIVYFGDTANDMQAVSACGKGIGIGVTVAGLSAPQELIRAGAKFVIPNYSSQVRHRLMELLDLN